MSLVGPAPEVPRFVAHYSDAERAVLRVRPGLADPAALDAGDAEAELARFADRRRGYEQCVLPQKLARSLAYLERRTLASDVGVLARTAVRIVRGPARPAPADTTTEAGFSTAHSAGLRQEES
jgi:lipopolysaccharide/colanic/teichoic acid biosynthesis glycosyltransferase